MSFNRLKYDNCHYTTELRQSMDTASWVLDPNRFENTNKCRVEFGLVGGTNVSHAKGNMIDVESDLLGTTRLNTKCPTQKFLNPCAVQNNFTNLVGAPYCQPSQIVIQQTPNTQGRVVNLAPAHLTSCQLVNYKNKLPNRYYPVRK